MSKKNFLSDIFDEFVGRTMKSVNPDRIIYDVENTIKRSIYDSVNAILHGILFPNEPSQIHSANPTNPGGERYSYQQNNTNYNAYFPNSQALRIPSQSTYFSASGCELRIPADYNQRGTYIEFIGPIAIRESERVMSDIRTRMNIAHIVTVGDLHSIAGIPTVPGDFDFGWTDISCLGRVIIRDGYRLVMPAPTSIR